MKSDLSHNQGSSIARHPIVVVEINGYPVRFFETPKDEAQFPWHAHSDLLTAVGFPAEYHADILMVVARDFPEYVARLHTDEGPVLICDNVVAKTCFTGPPAMFGVSRDASLASYFSALSRATTSITRYMGDPIGRATWLHNALRHDMRLPQMTLEEEREYRDIIAGEHDPWRPGGTCFGLPA